MSKVDYRGVGGKRVELGEPSMFLVKDGGALDYHDDSEDGEREAGSSITSEIKLITLDGLIQRMRKGEEVGAI